MINGTEQDERIYLDAKINVEPVRFSVDIGSTIPLVILSKTAQRLHLKVGDPSTNIGGRRQTLTR